MQRLADCENGAFFPVDRRDGGSTGSSLVHWVGMAIIGHVAISLCLFPYEGMTVTDVIDRADEALHRVKTSGKGNYSQADISVPEPLVVWVGAQVDACFLATATIGELRHERLQSSDNRP
ncbi:MAG: hypothetical protein ACOYBO_13815 [Azonexus sp.]